MDLRTRPSSIPTRAHGRGHADERRRRGEWEQRHDDVDLEPYQWARPFLDTLELVREVVDDDTGGAQMRQTLFILSGDYHDQRQVHVHQGAGPESVPSAPPPVPREPLRDANGNVFEAVEPLE